MTLVSYLHISRDPIFVLGTGLRPHLMHYWGESHARYCQTNYFTHQLILPAKASISLDNWARYDIRPIKEEIQLMRFLTVLSYTTMLLILMKTSWWLLSCEASSFASTLNIRYNRVLWLFEDLYLLALGMLALRKYAHKYAHMDNINIHHDRKTKCHKNVYSEIWSPVKV